MAKPKKAATHINKVIPAVDINDGQLFDKLVTGECFLMNGGLYMKESFDEQIGVNLVTGKCEDYLRGRMVVPVVVTIAWKKK